MKDTNITYFKLPLNLIPFKEIPSLEKFKSKYAYCKAISLKSFMGDDYYLISVFDYWSEKELNNQSEIENIDLLFGEILSDKYDTRGELKCSTIAKTQKLIKKEELPHFRYCSSKSENPNANWFYLKDGDYFIFSAIKSDSDSVKHLEKLVIYGDNIIRLRIVIELMKKNMKKEIVNVKEEEINKIAFNVLRSNPSLAKSDKGLIKEGVSNFLPYMLSMPLYKDIPQNIRGRVRQ